MDNIVRPDFDEREKSAIELIEYLKEDGAPLGSVKFLKYFRMALENIYNGNVKDNGEVGENGIERFIIGFHDYDTGIQYVASHNNDETVNVYTNIPVYSFIDNIENQNKKFMEVIYQAYKENYVDTDYVTMFYTDDIPQFTFKDFIKKLEEVMQRIIDTIPPILLNNTKHY